MPLLVNDLVFRKALAACEKAALQRHPINPVNGVDRTA